METKNSDLSSLKINRSENNSGSPNKKKTTIIISLLAAVIIAFIGYSILSPLFSREIKVNLVEVSLQSPAQTDAVFTASGYVVAQRKAAVASKGTGRLIYLGVVEGDKVKKDEIIARLEDSDVKAQLAEAKANLQLQKAGLIDAKNNYNRQKALIKTGSTTPADLDAAQANYEKTLASIELAKAQVQAAEVAVENTIIRAPFDGTVLTKNADVGEIVAPLAASVNSKGAVVTIADMSSLQVEADVSESNIERITPQQDCEITLDAYPSHSYPGYVSKIVPTADRTKATVMVKVGFRHYDKRVLPEMSAKVLFLSKETKESQKSQQPVLVVPSTAVVTRNGGKVVFTVRNNTASKIPVTTGQQFNSYIEIKSGLKNGDQIIENITDQIKDGTKVKISS
jgi:RND family efflux transporter MFP subunit